jgi:CHAT domain-containing protein/tetratricopeptide (TPR) repeat protein
MMRMSAAWLPGLLSWFAAVSLAGAVCSAQAPAAPAAGAPSPHSVEEGRAHLQAAEAAHPGNTEEVGDALIELVYDETMASAVNGETLALAERAAAVAEAAKGKESSLYALATAARARVLLMMDRPELARPMAEEAVRIEQKIGASGQEMSDAAAALSLVCEHDGDKPCTLKMAELQVSAMRGVKDVPPLDLATALVGLMHARRINADMPGGRAAADETAALADRAETSTPEWAIIENNLGGFYMLAGDFDMALAHLKKSLAMSTALYGADSTMASGVIANLAYAEMCLGHSSDALAYYAQARTLFAQHYGVAYSQTARIEAGYGYALGTLGRTKEAVEAEVAAHQLQREHIRLAIRLMPEQEALTMVNTGSESFNAAVSIATHDPSVAEPVYQEVVRSRSLVAEEMAQRQAVLNRKLDPAVEALQQQFKEEEKSVMQLQGTAQTALSSIALRDATLKMEQTERELAEHSAAFRADERAQDSKLADLRKNLPPGSVLVSYVVFLKLAADVAHFNKMPVQSYTAFVLHGDSERIGVYDLGDSHSIADLVKRMRASADAEAHGGGMGSTRNEREYREAGLELRKRIWDPLSADVAAKKLVLVVPDGILDLVPFSALPLDKGYFVEHGPVVHILTSERDLLTSPALEKKAGLLAIGSPSFEGSSTETASALRGAPTECDVLNKMEFHDLPASLGEVKDISGLWKRWNGTEPEQLLTGEDATQARFIDAASQARVLHIATHAFVLEKKCGNGNPLLHSGLVFAGVNKDRNTAIMTAQQIASLDLRGVDWAVLSACNTGYGELRDGEGVMGLERAFRVAGAKSVVMALWPVDDAATRDFMEKLYVERFSRRATTADAAWLAARSVLAARQAAGSSTHPWYWAGFVSSGAWE